MGDHDRVNSLHFKSEFRVLNASYFLIIFMYFWKRAGMKKMCFGRKDKLKIVCNTPKIEANKNFRNTTKCGT